MSDFTGIPNNQKRYFEWLIIIGFIYLLLFIYVGAFTLIAAFLFNRRKPSKRVYAWACAFALLLWSFFFIASQQSISYWLNPRLAWWHSILLFPIVSVLLHGIVMFSRFAKPKSLQEQLAEQERAEAVRQAKLSQRAGRRTEVNATNAILRLGAKIKGDQFPEHLGVSLQDGWLVIDESVLDQHLFVLGTTGAGKSETIKRLVFEILKATNRNIYLVDGKGDEELANDIRSLAYYHGRGRAPVFKLGFEKFGAVYDGFRGQPTDIYNRLCALIGTSEAEGDAQYYADINRDLLQLICYASVGPPRSFEELRARLSKKWLEEAYKGDELELTAIRQLEDRQIQGLSHRLRPLARACYELFQVERYTEGYGQKDIPQRR